MSKLSDRVKALEKQVAELEKLVMLKSNTGGKLGAVKSWLTEHLADGPEPVSEVKEAARVAGIGKIILVTAKRELGVLTIGDSGGFLWELKQ